MMLFCPVTRKLCKNVNVIKMECEVTTCALTGESLATLSERGVCPKNKTTEEQS